MARRRRLQAAGQRSVPIKLPDAEPGPPRTSSGTHPALESRPAACGSQAANAATTVTWSLVQALCGERIQHFGLIVPLILPALYLPFTCSPDVT